MWNKEAILKVVTTKEFAVGVSSVVSLVAGAAGGYLFAKKKLEKQFEAALDVEIAKTQEFYSKLHKTGDYSDPSKLVEKYGADAVPTDDEDDITLDEVREAIVELKYAEDGETVVAETEEVEVQVSLKQNVFDNPGDDAFDSQAELTKKRSGKPYIIGSQEFLENEAERNQICLTYYEGDDTLADEADRIINDVRHTIGEDNLRFGAASNDPNIVYIRNERIDTEYEVVRSEGSYSVEVAGFIEHAEKTPLRKFRVYD